MKQNIKGAIFDLDGTLVNSLILWDVIWDSLGTEFLNIKNFRPKPEDDKAVRTMTLPQAAHHIHKTYNIGKSAEELDKFITDLLIDFYENKVELKPGVLSLLDMLYENNVKMCIASASDLDAVKVAVKHCKIEKYFSTILSCNTINKGKDEPDIYLIAQEHLGTSTKETWVFEDSLIAINTANKIGLNTVGIYDENNFGHDEMKKISTIYISENEDLSNLRISDFQ